MTDGACQDEKVKDGMHIALFVQRIEKCACDITDPFCYNPCDSSRGNIVNQRFEGHQYAKTHTNETEGFYIGMLFQANKTDNRSGNGTEPDKRKQTPANR